MLDVHISEPTSVKGKWSEKKFNAHSITGNSGVTANVITPQVLVRFQNAKCELILLRKNGVMSGFGTDQKSYSNSQRFRRTFG
jgi:hypothetical protein